MIRLKNGRVSMELKEANRNKGYTMRANINSDLIQSLKKWGKDSARIINIALKNEDGKAIIKEMQNASWRNRRIRELSENHDKLVYDASGIAIAWWDHKEQKMYDVID